MNVSWVFKKDDLERSVPDASVETIICREHQSNGKTVRSFKIFQRGDELNRLLLSEGAHFYECVPGVLPRKMYFDLDFVKGGGAKQVLRDVVEKLRELGSEKILVFSSSDERKDSFHVVAADLVVRDNHHAKFVARQEFGHLDIDFAVYSSFQQFRCYRSCKIGTTRIKKMTNFADVPSRDSEELLSLSLLTCLTGEEKEIPGFDESRPEKKREHAFRGCDSTSLETVLRSVSHFAEFVTQEEGLLLFKRIETSHCEECQREHENDNPFAVILSNGDVVMHCRRSERKRGVVIGNVSADVVIDIQEVPRPPVKIPTRTSSRLTKLC